MSDHYPQGGYNYGGQPYSDYPPPQQPPPPAYRYPPQPYGDYPAPNHPTPGQTRATPTRTTSAATAVFTILLAIPLAIDQAIGIVGAKDLLPYFADLDPQSQASVGVVVGATVVLVLGLLLLMGRVSFGRLLIALGALAVAVSAGSALATLYGSVDVPQIGGSGFLWLLSRQAVEAAGSTLDDLENIAIAMLTALTIAGLLAALFALLPSTRRWCKRR